MGKFKKGDKVRVIKVEESDKEYVCNGDVFDVVSTLKLYTMNLVKISVPHSPSGYWNLKEEQVELVEEDKKPFRVGQPKTNYIQETIELLEEDKKDEHNDYHALESVIRELDREIAEKYEAIEELKVARDVLDMKLRDKKKG